MSANRSTAADETGVSRPRPTLWSAVPLWQWILIALLLGVAIGVGVGLLQHSRRSMGPAASTLPARPVATWRAGEQRAPGFRLVDERGAPIALSQFRGRPVIVTFIDPVCRSLCPLEAKELNRAVTATPPAARPVIVSISVNPWADSRAIFRKDAREWRLVPQWHWAAGRYAQLSPVWKRYKIGVLTTRKVFHGITVRDVSHTEASYLIDASGYKRALFLYPFRGADIAAALKRVSSGKS